MIDYSIDYIAIKGGFLRNTEDLNSYRNQGAGPLYGFSESAEIIRVDESYSYPKVVRFLDPQSPNAFDCCFLASMAFHGHGNNSFSRDVLKWMTSNEFREIWEAVPATALNKIDLSGGITGNIFLDQILDMAAVAAKHRGYIGSRDNKKIPSPDLEKMHVRGFDNPKNIHCRGVDIF